MNEIFKECRRVIKPNGIMVVMFTHRSNDAWNAMTIGLMEAGFNVTRTWPVKTEAESSFAIRDKAAARSTILLVCRPAGKRNPKAWHEVAQEIAAAPSGGGLGWGRPLRECGTHLQNLTYLTVPERSSDVDCQAGADNKARPFHRWI